MNFDSYFTSGLSQGPSERRSRFNSFSSFTPPSEQGGYDAESSVPEMRCLNSKLLDFALIQRSRFGIETIRMNTIDVTGTLVTHEHFEVGDEDYITLRLREGSQQTYRMVGISPEFRTTMRASLSESVNIQVQPDPFDQNNQNRIYLQPMRTQERLPRYPSARAR
jgi:hypothetical protein